MADQLFTIAGMFCMSVLAWWLLTDEDSQDGRDSR